MKKNLLFVLAATALMASCNTAPKTESMDGVYKMDKSVLNDGTTDNEQVMNDSIAQYKIYTPTHYFFIATGKDSAVAFGVGNYTMADGKVSETNIFNTNTLDTAGSVGLEITKSEKGYTQLIPSMTVGGKTFKLTEDYTTVPATGTSALDGVWHQVKNLVINGNDTVDGTYNEYKIFHAGHFMWAARAINDSAAMKYKNFIGSGTFTLANEALTENLEFTSMSGIKGKYNIIVNFNGTDEFTQKTADTAAKVVGFKTYKRISK
jgi:hypothetical protein